MAAICLVQGAVCSSSLLRRSQPDNLWIVMKVDAEAWSEGIQPARVT